VQFTPLAQGWRFFKGFLVFLIVTFHLVVLAIRNPLDLWHKPIKEWLEKEGYWKQYGERFDLADNFTKKYTNFVGCEQRWVMFSPPLARRAPFLAVRYEFTDGSSEMVLSEQEPADMTSFFRVGGWQQRKLEDFLLDVPSNPKTDDEFPVWEAFARYSVRQWRQQHPNDPRKIDRVVLVRRRISFPAHDKDPRINELLSEKDLAVFDAEGRHIP
jgi:hypothetical protein